MSSGVMKLRAKRDAAEPHRLAVYSLDDMIHGTLAQSYLVKGLIAPGALSTWFGPPGSGKSFLLTHIAFAVAQGRAVFGHRVTQAAALYAHLEGEDGFKRRLRALSAKFGPCDKAFFTTKPLNIFKDKSDTALLIEAVNATQARLLVVDTLARATTGCDENSSAHMGKVLNACSEIIQVTGVHLALVHHVGKAENRGARGHSSLLGAVDQLVEVKSAKGRHSFRVLKARDEALSPMTMFGLEVVELGRDADGDPITTCTVREDGGSHVDPAAEPERALPPSARVALECLRSLKPQGVAASSIPGIPENAQVAVSEEDLRRAAYSAGISKGEDRAQQLAFSRALSVLESEGLVGRSGGYAFLLQRT